MLLLTVRVGDLEKELDSERCRRTNDTVNSAQQETQKQTPRGKGGSDRLERIQRRAAKLIPELRDLSCGQALVSQ